MVAAADEEVQVLLADGEARRGQLALGRVEVDEAVDQVVTHVAGDGLLPGQRAGRGLGAEGGAGRGPPGIPALEALQEGPGGRLVGGGPVGRERRAVEVADEVLRARAAGDPAGVEADQHDPLDVATVPVDGQREEVRALPHSARRVGGAELRQPSPLLEVRGAPDEDLVLGGDHGHHPPLLGRGVPEHLGVPELAASRCRSPGCPRTWSRSARRPWSTRGTAPGCRHDRSRACRRWCTSPPSAGSSSCRSPSCSSCRRRREPEKTPSLASKGIARGCWSQCTRSLLDGVAPGHVAPDVPERVVLEEQVVDALVVDEPVRVVHPVLGRAEVVGGPVLRRVVGRRGRRPHAQGGEHGDDEQDDAATASRTRTGAG